MWRVTVLAVLGALTVPGWAEGRTVTVFPCRAVRGVDTCTLMDRAGRAVASRCVAWTFDPCRVVVVSPAGFVPRMRSQLFPREAVLVFIHEGCPVAVVT